MADMVLGFTTWTGGTYETGVEGRRGRVYRSDRTKGLAGSEKEWWGKDSELGIAKVSGEVRACLEVEAEGGER